MRLQKLHNTGTRVSKTKLLPVPTTRNNITVMNSQRTDNQGRFDRNDSLNKVAAACHFQKFLETYSLPLGTQSTPEFLRRQSPSVDWLQNIRRHPQDATPPPRCPWPLHEPALPTKIAKTIINISLYKESILQKKTLTASSLC